MTRPTDAVATGPSSIGQEGRLYALDGLGKLRGKAILAGESVQWAVPPFDHLGNLHLVADPRIGDTHVLAF